MSAPICNSKTSERRQTMLRSACRDAVRAALGAVDVIEILVNGRLDLLLDALFYLS